MTELLPCPFCGLSWIIPQVDRDKAQLCFECLDCGARGPHVSTLREVGSPEVSGKIIEAQTLWNTRAKVDNA